MTRPVILIDIGADPLPAATPVSRAAASWVPPLAAAVVIPPADDVEVTPAADSITITWAASPLAGAVYVVWRAPDINGAPGNWSIVARTTDTRYTYTDTTGAVSWWKITVVVNGVSSGDSDSAAMAPIVPPTVAELVLIQQALDQESADRFAADAEAVAQAAADATAKANAARDAAIAHADALGAAVADIIDADEWEAATTYPTGDFVQRAGKLYRALRASTGAEPESSPDDWKLVGNYASVGEAVAAAVDMAHQVASELEAESSRLDSVVARMPSGSGGLATAASVTDEATARASAVSALGNRVGVVEARMPSGSGGLATAASVTDEATARASADGALGNRVGVVEARMPSGSGGLATAASVTDEATARSNADGALGSRIDATNAEVDGKASAGALNSLQAQVTQQGNTLTTQGAAISSVQSKLGIRSNLLPNGGFEQGLWASAGDFAVSDGGWGRCIYHKSPASIGSGGYAIYSDMFPSPGGSTMVVSYDSVLFASAGQVSADVEFYNSSGAFLSNSIRVGLMKASHDFEDGDARLQARAGAVAIPSDAFRCRIRLIWEGLTNCQALYFRRVKVEKGALPATAYTMEGTAVQQAAVMQSMQATVTQQGNNIATLLARYMLVVQAGGLIGGMQIGNDGTTVATKFLSNIFEIIAPSANNGVEFKSGCWRVFNSATQVVMGNAFGANADMMWWVGPNVGIANCTQSNCLECLTTSGTRVQRSSVSGARTEVIGGASAAYDANGVKRAAWGVGI